MNTPKPVTVAICGCGVRGMQAYAQYAKKTPDKMKIVAGADIDPDRIALLKKDFDLTDAQCFDSAEELLAQPRLADVMMITTQDQQHVEQALLALDKGYHLIVEKPISPDLQECLALQKKAHEANRLVVICHVLRYTQFYSAIHDLLEQNTIGDLQTLDAVEHIAYWHYAHSYVRGNWRKKEETSPAILAKCCHDMDIIRWLVGKPCVRLNSFGSLNHFTAQNAPDGCTGRCLDGCAAKETCPYDAEKIYLANKGSGFYDIGTGWPCSVLTNFPTKESIYNALEEGPYGRCVYHCDNDVADHQVVSMEFEGNITATFTMSAFTQECYRTIKIMGSHGEIEGNMDSNIIHVRRFGEAERVIELSNTVNEFAGHGGGDMGMMEGVCELLSAGGLVGLTGIDASVESHVMALAAEESRLQNGVCIELAQFAK